MVAGPGRGESSSPCHGFVASVRSGLPRAAGGITEPGGVTLAAD
jgi:hypothetical protein